MPVLTLCSRLPQELQRACALLRRSQEGRARQMLFFFKLLTLVLKKNQLK